MDVIEKSKSMVSLEPISTDRALSVFDGKSRNHNYSSMLTKPPHEVSKINFESENYTIPKKQSLKFNTFRRKENLLFSNPI